jgi:hypothetical protein
MVDHGKLVRRRSFLGLMPIGGLLLLIGGCGQEGAGSVKVSSESQGGGQKRLKKMQEGVEKALETKPATRKR